MKLFKTAIALVALSSGMAHAELIVLDSQETNEKNTLSYLVGSAAVSGKLVKGTFSIVADSKIDNMNIGLERKSCDAGLGTMYFFDIEDSHIVGKLGWVKGDGTLADTAATVLCGKLTPAKAKKTAF